MHPRERLDTEFRQLVEKIYALMTQRPEPKLAGREPAMQGAALGMFLIARSGGWIAHAIEQYESGVLIRPRARYTGRR